MNCTGGVITKTSYMITSVKYCMNYFIKMPTNKVFMFGRCVLI